MGKTTAYSNLKASFGPGLLFAASAVGLSHLVQATRAGAGYGLALVGVIIIACLVKYPALRFGSSYAAATGTSLLAAYRQQGRVVLGIYAVFEVTAAGFVIAALTLFSAGLLQAITPINFAPGIISFAILALVAALLLSGKYRRLERLTAICVVTFTVLILAATAAAVPQLDLAEAQLLPARLNAPLLAFIVPLVGFMPTTPTASVMQSLWTVAKLKQMSPRQDGVAQSQRLGLRLDFDIGYGGTCFLALCFVVIGAISFHQSGTAIATSNVAFASQFTQVFSQLLGSWSFGVVAAGAFLIIFSTLITVIDGLTRVIQALLTFRYQDEEQVPPSARTYRLILIALCAVSFAIILFLARQFTVLLDILGVLTFVVSPLIAWFNHKAITSRQVPPALQPSLALRYWSWIGIAVLCSAGFAYLALRFFA